MVHALFKFLRFSDEGDDGDDGDDERVNLDEHDCDHGPNCTE